MLAVVAGVLALSGLLLAHLQASQRLGEPGVELWGEALPDPQGNPVGTNSVHLPTDIPGYKSLSTPVARVVTEMLPPDTTYGQRRYTAEDGFWVDNSVVLMGADRSSIHKPQFCMVGQGWTILKSTPLTIPMEAPHAYDLPVMRLDVSQEFTLKNGQKHRYSGVYVYWFVSNDQLTSDHWDRQYWMARDLILDGVLKRWAYITYFAACEEGLENVTYERMKGLITQAVPRYQKVAGPSRSSTAPATARADSAPGPASSGALHPQ